LLSNRDRDIIPVGNLKVGFPMKEKPDVLQGTLTLMVLKTFDVPGPQHGYGTPNPRLRSVMPPGSMRPSLRKAAHEAFEGKHVRGIRGIARRVEQISGDILALNQGTLYPLLFKLEHESSIVSQWGASENNRRARFYRLTATGRKQLQAEARDWEQTAAIIARFFEVKAEDLP
jgi:PadR family transcriptional regulator, regulatory protein PadR